MISITFLSSDWSFCLKELCQIWPGFSHNAPTVQSPHCGAKTHGLQKQTNLSFTDCMILGKLLHFYLRLTDNYLYIINLACVKFQRTWTHFCVPLSQPYHFLIKYLSESHVIRIILSRGDYGLEMKTESTEMKE